VRTPPAVLRNTQKRVHNKNVVFVFIFNLVFYLSFYHIHHKMNFTNYKGADWAFGRALAVGPQRKTNLGRSVKQIFCKISKQKLILYCAKLTVHKSPDPAVVGLNSTGANFSTGWL
jgi:hypothetical protein